MGINIVAFCLSLQFSMNEVYPEFVLVYRKKTGGKDTRYWSTESTEILTILFNFYISRFWMYKWHNALCTMQCTMHYALKAFKDGKGKVWKFSNVYLSRKVSATKILDEKTLFRSTRLQVNHIPLRYRTGARFNPQVRKTFKCQCFNVAFFDPSRSFHVGCVLSSWSNLFLGEASGGEGNWGRARSGLDWNSRSLFRGVPCQC